MEVVSGRIPFMLATFLTFWESVVKIVVCSSCSLIHVCVCVCPILAGQTFDVFFCGHGCFCSMGRSGGGGGGGGAGGPLRYLQYKLLP